MSRRWVGGLRQGRRGRGHRRLARAGWRPTTIPEGRLRSRSGDAGRGEGVDGAWVFRPRGRRPPRRGSAEGAVLPVAGRVPARPSDRPRRDGRGLGGREPAAPAAGRPEDLPRAAGCGHRSAGSWLSRRAMREAVFAARLEHRHAVTIHHVVEHEGGAAPGHGAGPVAATVRHPRRADTTLHEQETATPVPRSPRRWPSRMPRASSTATSSRPTSSSPTMVPRESATRHRPRDRRQHRDVHRHAHGHPRLPATRGGPCQRVRACSCNVSPLGSTLYATSRARPPFGQDRVDRSAPSGSPLDRSSLPPHAGAARRC